uniref:Uncharacterized protein n=1 Tax=Octopus bimaculoides TaxID=37653 RepID=A0A0L8FQQ2_OCTBM
MPSFIILCILSGNRNKISFSFFLLTEKIMDKTQETHGSDSVKHQLWTNIFFSF